MSFVIDCDVCPNELKQPGALLFGPPDDQGKAQKLHICISCWEIWRANNPKNLGSVFFPPGELQELLKRLQQDAQGATEVWAKFRKLDVRRLILHVERLQDENAKLRKVHKEVLRLERLDDLGSKNLHIALLDALEDLDQHDKEKL